MQLAMQAKLSMEHLDNASGVVDIMGAAKAMALSGIRLKRSVVFLFIGGEEIGLLGSKLYTAKPVFPKEKTITYINLDMVGNGTGLAVNAGSTYKELLKYFVRPIQIMFTEQWKHQAPVPGSILWQTKKRWCCFQHGRIPYNGNRNYRLV